MDSLEKIVIQRIQTIDLDLLCDIVEKFKKYGVNFYNRQGRFDYNKFRQDCQKTSLKLFKNDMPHPVTNIRYQYADFLSAVQTITGIRNFNRFMAEADNRMESIANEI